MLTPKICLFTLYSVCIKIAQFIIFLLSQIKVYKILSKIAKLGNISLCICILFAVYAEDVSLVLK